MQGYDEGIIRCPLGPSRRRLQMCGFGETLFDGMRSAPLKKAALTRAETKDRLTYEKFIAKSELIARHLLRLGCRKGDVLVIFAPNSIEWMLILTACLRIGVVPAGISALEQPDELSNRLQLCGAKWVFTVVGCHLETAVAATTSASGVRGIICTGSADQIQANHVTAAYPQCISFESFSKRRFDLPSLPEFDDLRLSPKDVAMMAFSSGTTGRAKAILLSHLNLQAQFIIASDERVWKISENQVIFAPLGHLGGGLMMLYGLALGYTSHLMTSFNIGLYLQTISENKNQTIAIVPSVALAMTKLAEEKWNRYDLSCLRDILCGTAPLTKKVEDMLSQRLPTVQVRQGYGLTETTAACTTIPRLRESKFARTKSGSIGVPLFNVEIKVVDTASGETLAPNQQGELMIRSHLVMNSYKESEKVHTSEVIDEDGWLHTGDVGYYDNDGYFWIVDRISDMISCNSFLVSPSELESVLLCHPRVTDAAVFALKSATSGRERPAAWVVQKNGENITEEELHSFVSENVERNKLLTGGITFVESIPRSSNGKILRRNIQNLVASKSTNVRALNCGTQRNVTQSKLLPLTVKPST